MAASAAAYALLAFARFAGTDYGSSMPAHPARETLGQWLENSAAIARETSSSAAATSEVVEAAAALCAWLSDEPMPAISEAVADINSGAASADDIAAPPECALVANACEEPRHKVGRRLVGGIDRKASNGEQLLLVRSKSQ